MATTEGYPRCSRCGGAVEYQRFESQQEERIRCVLCGNIACRPLPPRAVPRTATKKRKSDHLGAL